MLPVVQETPFPTEAAQLARSGLLDVGDSAVKESTHRVESAIKTTGFSMPRQNAIVNLAPADIRKEGTAFDLPIAICIT